MRRYGWAVVGLGIAGGTVGPGGWGAGAVVPTGGAVRTGFGAPVLVGFGGAGVFVAAGVGGAGVFVAAGVDPGLELAGLEVTGLEVARSGRCAPSLATAAAGGGSQCSCEQIVEPSRSS